MLFIIENVLTIHTEDNLLKILQPLRLSERQQQDSSSTRTSWVQHWTLKGESAGTGVTGQELRDA